MYWDGRDLWEIRSEQLAGMVEDWKEEVVEVEEAMDKRRESIGSVIP